MNTFTLEIKKNFKAGEQHRESKQPHYIQEEPQLASENGFKSWCVNSSRVLASGNAIV